MITPEELTEGRILLIDKPLQWSSFQAVNKIKWAILRHYKLKKIKIGHAGTLDPLATGLLILCTGKNTKQIPFLQETSKVYTGVMTLGATTPSFDMETSIDAHYPVEHITEELVAEVCAQFTGELIQEPPLFSAIKKDGKRLYSEIEHELSQIRKNVKDLVEIIIEYIFLSGSVEIEELVEFLKKEIDLAD